MPNRRADVSAGILVFRIAPGGPELLLAHPGGPFWAKKDHGAWTIPKGLVEGGVGLLETAIREFREETGLVANGPFLPLAPVKQKSGKVVHGFACEADLDLAGWRSNSFELEWPPRSGRRVRFPEIDRVAYFGTAEADEKIIPYQRPLILQLLGILGSQSQAPP